MRLKTLMTINAIISAVFGIAFVLMPGQTSALYGVEANAAMRYVGQLFGASLITFAVLTWTARDSSDSDARRAIVLALFIGNAVGFVVALIAQLGSVVNTLGWSTVVLYLLLDLGFGYFQFSKPGEMATPPTM